MMGGGGQILSLLPDSDTVALDGNWVKKKREYFNENQKEIVDFLFL